MKDWIKTSDELPDNNVLVMTKVADDRGDHSQVILKRHKNLWFNFDTSVYVYYTPTHWRSI